MRALLLVLLLIPALVPPSAATWVSHGQSEPDTALDATSPFMWPSAPGESRSRVYFQAYATLGDTGANPNVALVPTHMRPTPVLRFEAVLGIWVDCNGDGAIGLSEGAIEEYSSILLLNTQRCPGGTTHNDGTTVRELRAIGRGPDAPIDNAETIVWGDAGLPGARGLETCTVFPLPRGTTANTGRTLRVLDCAAEHRVLGAVNTIDNDGALGLRIDDVHNPEQSDSLLVRHAPANLFGNPINGQRGLIEEGSGAPAFVAWDCGSTAFRIPSAPTDPTSVSYWDAIGIVADGTIDDCDPETGTPISPLYPGIEQPFEPGSHTGRDQNDVVFVHSTQAQPAFTLEPWQGAAASDAAGPVAIAPPTVGGGNAPGHWRATSAFIMSPHLLDRGAFEPAGAAYWTFFAHIGVGVYAMGFSTPGGTGFYGAEACGSNDSGVHGGWQCDSDVWWTDPAGDTMPRDANGVPWGARIGQPYQLRDVDCDDGLAAAFFTELCPRA